MAFEIGTASGHYDLLAKIKTFVETALPSGQRWIPQRTDSTTDNHEVIWKAPGLDGLQELYMGLKTYQSITSDYYNIMVQGQTGYVPSNSFETQPGRHGKIGTPLWNQAIPYWFIGNGQRLIVVAKIENVYESFYMGKYLPYATPQQYPYPMAIGGMCAESYSIDNHSIIKRYSDTIQGAWFKGNQRLTIRTAAGEWRMPDCFPYAGNNTLRNTASLSTNPNGYYGLHPLIISENNGSGDGIIHNVFGELDGVYWISGFNNAVENTVIISDITYVVLRDTYRAGFKDYVAIKLA